MYNMNWKGNLFWFSCIRHEYILPLGYRNFFLLLNVIEIQDNWGRISGYLILRFVNAIFPPVCLSLLLLTQVLVYVSFVSQLQIFRI